MADTIKAYPRVFVVTMRAVDGRETVHAHTSSRDARAHADFWAREAPGTISRIDLYRLDEGTPVPGSTLPAPP